MMDIKLDDLRGSEIARLLSDHLESISGTAPPESQHTLDLDSLRAPDITFWSVWDENTLAGCGALKKLDDQHAEIKSMKTADRFLNRGVATVLLAHIIQYATNQNYQRLSLETGSMEYFKPARHLYARFDFEPCPPFAGYIEDINSVYMTRLL